jgi:hypothetical protein
MFGLFYNVAIFKPFKIVILFFSRLFKGHLSVMKINTAFSPVVAQALVKPTVQRPLKQPSADVLRISNVNSAPQLRAGVKLSIQMKDLETMYAKRLPELRAVATNAIQAVRERNQQLDPHTLSKIALTMMPPDKPTPDILAQLVVRDLKKIFTDSVQATAKLDSNFDSDTQLFLNESTQARDSLSLVHTVHLATDEKSIKVAIARRVGRVLLTEKSNRLLDNCETLMAGGFQHYAETHGLTPTKIEEKPSVAERIKKFFQKS